MHSFPRATLVASVSLALLSACASPSTSFGGGVGAPQNAEAHQIARRVSQAPRQNQPLLYVMTDANFAFVADYPSGGSLHRVSVRTNLTGTNICSDANGHVFMTGYDGSISVKGYVFEFAHGGNSPISTLTSGDVPTACSVDPTTGNLAVTSAVDGNCHGSKVSIYVGATGTPMTYEVSDFTCLTGAAYDQQGNLFVGGRGSGSGMPYAIAELGRSSASFTDIALNEQIACARGNCDVPLQWNGSDLLITKPTADHKSPTVYKVEISGSVGTVVRSTTFHGKFRQLFGYGGVGRGGQDHSYVPRE